MNCQHNLCQVHRYTLAHCTLISRSTDESHSLLHIPEHPGGEAILLEHAGSDASREFSLANHSALAINLAESFVIWPVSGLFDPTKRMRKWTRSNFT